MKTVDVDGSMRPILSRDPLMMSEKETVTMREAAWARPLTRRLIMSTMPGTDGSCSVASRTHKSWRIKSVSADARQSKRV